MGFNMTVENISKRNSHIVWFELHYLLIGVIIDDPMAFDLYVIVGRIIILLG